MDKFSIEGGLPLEGEISISGAKNSGLPVLAACLLTAEPVILRRVPAVRDIQTMKRLLQHTGATVTDEADGSIRVEAREVSRPEAPYDSITRVLYLRFSSTDTISDSDRFMIGNRLVF